MESVLNPLEIELLLTAIKRQYDYDFSDYAKTSLHRRLLGILSKHKIDNLGECQHRVIQDPGFFYTMLNDLTITVSDLFRDPLTYKALMQHVVPYLQSYPSFKLWHAGCATGEEVYSLAILLKENGLYEKAIIYATDINQRAMEYAKSGLFSKKTIEQGMANYKKINPNGNLNQYISMNEQDGILDASLRDKVVFSKHNLVVDQSFGEMQLIMCRNVLIYFNKSLQERVLRLFTDSLCIGGYLCLGSRETLKFSEVKQYYEVVDKDARIYRKVAESC